MTWRTTAQNCPSSLSFTRADELGLPRLRATRGTSSAVQLCNSLRGAQPCTLHGLKTSRAYGSFTAYDKDLFCGSPAADFDLDPVTTHTAVVTALEPGQLYYYM